MSQETEEVLKRFFVRCRMCKQKWAEEHPARLVRTNVVPVGMTHRCPAHDFGAHADSIMRKVRELQLKRAEAMRLRPELYLPRTDEDLFAEQWWREMVGPDRYFRYEPLKWKPKPGGVMTECGPRCMAATGPSCDCRCRGKNHGSRGVSNLST